MGVKKIVVIEQAGGETVTSSSTPLDKPTTDETTADKITADEPTNSEPIEKEEPKEPEEPNDVSAEVSVESEPNPGGPETLKQKARKAHAPAPLITYIRKFLKVKKLRLHRKTVVVGLVIILVLVGIYLIVKPTSSQSNPLPASVKQRVKFSLYYPQSPADGYKYLAGSSNYISGKLTYNLGPGSTSDGNPVIRVSEQALVGQGPDLNKLPNFSIFQAPAGQAAVGTNGDVVNGVLVTHKTLIILNGLNGVTENELKQAIDNMQA